MSANNNNNNPTAPLRFPSTMERYLAGATRTAKVDLFDTLPLGVPMDLPKDGDSDVLILHQRKQALPNRFHEYSEAIPALEATEALQNCDYVHVVLTDHSKGRNQCWALVPQYESYHIQKWMRIPEDIRGGGGGNNLVSADVPLRLVGRGMKTNGLNEFDPPLVRDMRQNWELLQTYISSFGDVLKELKPLVEKVATSKKTVTVMVCNFGQSELLVNFVCAAKSRHLDTSSILVFATDMETKALAEHLGLTAFYDERVSIRPVEFENVISHLSGEFVNTTVYRSEAYAMRNGTECYYPRATTDALSHTQFRLIYYRRILVPCPKKLPVIMAIVNLRP